MWGRTLRSRSREWSRRTAERHRRGRRCGDHSHPTSTLPALPATPGLYKRMHAQHVACRVASTCCVCTRTSCSGHCVAWAVCWSAWPCAGALVVCRYSTALPLGMVGGVCLPWEEGELSGDEASALLPASKIHPPDLYLMLSSRRRDPRHAHPMHDSSPSVRPPRRVREYSDHTADAV